MFSSSVEKKSLIIIYDKDTKEYANLLEQLISAGKKEDAIQVTCASIKEGTDNKFGMTQNTYILYIGNSEGIKENTSHIGSRFEKYGMHYGWIGRRGVLYVRTTVSEQFDLKGLKKFVDERDRKLKKYGTKNSEWDKVVNGLKTSPLWSLLPFGGLMVTFVAGTKAYKDLIAIKYSCLVKTLFLEGLDKFLEE